MPNPWDNDPIVGAPQSSPVTLGTPNPYKQQSQQQDLTKGGLDIQAKQLEIESKRLDIEKSKAGTEKDKLGVEQGKAGGFYSRAVDANSLYEGLGVGAPSALREGAQAVLPNAVVNTFTDPDRQRAEAAQADFIASTLRYESGAAIPPEEMEAQRRRYFPVAGDAPETIQLKARLRQNAIEALKTSAGPAAVQPARSADAPDSGIKDLTPEQRSAYAAFWKANPNPSPEQLTGFLGALGVGTVTNAQEIIDAAQQGAGFNTAVQENLPPELQQQVDQRLANTGAGGAAVAGGADTVTMGTFDELSAVADTIGGAFSGNAVNFGDQLAAERAFQRGLQEQHGGAYLGGQLGGGLVLPTFGAKTAGQLAKVGAGYGAAYGAGSGEGTGRVTNALLGGATGAGIGYGLGRGTQALAGRGSKDVPPLVGGDGRLNEPLEALRPGQRVAAAQEFGIDLPLGAATDRGGAILEKGLDILPGSAGVMNDARRVTEGQVSGAVEGVASKFGSAKTLNEAGGEAQRGAREWMGRFEATAAKAYDAIPISPAAKASTASTVATLTDLTGRFASNPELQQQVGSKQLTGFLEAIQSKGLTWDDMKSLRSFIGEKIGERRLTDDATTSDLRAVYGALSEDMKTTAAAMGPKASAAFNRANTLYRQGQERIDKALISILGNDGAKNPEAAAKAIQAMTMGGKGSGDLAKLAQVKAATVKSGAWDEVAGALIRIGGQPVDSPGRTFSPQTFIQWYSDMAEPARSMLFKPELRKTLDQFVAVNQRLAGTNALRNTSNTAPNILAGGVMGSMGIAAINPLLGAKLVAGMAANYGMAKLWTNPKFVQWATGYSKAVSSGSSAAVKSQVGRLAKLGTTNPELREGIQALIKGLANDNAPQAGQIAASPNEGPQPEKDGNN